MPNIQGKEVDLGHECHDCGEIYLPGTGFDACTKAGHYVGQVETCTLPPNASMNRD